MFRIKKTVDLDNLTKLGFIKAANAFAYVCYTNCYAVGLDFYTKEIKQEYKKTPLFFISAVDRELHIFKHPNILNSELEIQRYLVLLREADMLEYIND